MRVKDKRLENHKWNCSNANLPKSAAAREDGKRKRRTMKTTKVTTKTSMTTGIRTSEKDDDDSDDDGNCDNK